MTTTRKLIAVHAIVIADSDEQLEHRGFDANGNAILRRSTIEVQPGAEFSFPEGPELLSLIETGAARLSLSVDNDGGLA